MFDTLGDLKDIIFHIVVYSFLWRILSELTDLKEYLKRKNGGIDDN